MNIDDDKIDAEASAALCRRYGFVRSLVLGCAMAGAMLPALAGPKEKNRDEPRQQQAHQRELKQEIRQQRQPEQRQPDPRQYEQRQFDGRAFENRNDDQRRQLQIQEQNARAEAMRRNGRMTPDERRDLRRQINEAGLDIYPNTPRR